MSNPLKLSELRTVLLSKGFREIPGGKVGTWSHPHLDHPIYLKAKRAGALEGARAVVVHPELFNSRPALKGLPGLEVEDKPYHNSNMRAFPSRLNDGQKPTRYGLACTFRADQAFHTFLNELLVSSGERPEPTTFEPSSFWWVNNKQTYKHEVGGNYIWSPVTNKDGARNEFYENMKRMNVGDAVFCYAGGGIRALGVCTGPAALMPRPKEFGLAGEAWLDEGWMVAVRFQELSSSRSLKPHMDALADTLPEKYSPIRASGDGNQGAYLASVPPAMANALIAILDDEWRDFQRWVDRQDWTSDAEGSEAEARLEEAISNRTDIGEVEKRRLVNARRGQGVYRKNLTGFERACRITGVKDLRHLRASHIKPWRMSSDFEKLDGNNGLLLSPHIDHLFDGGYISFEDDGTILVADEATQHILDLWSIAAGTSCGNFRLKQIPYIQFHRDVIFERRRKADRL